MTQEDEQILKQINSIWRKTDAFLVNHDNSLLLFDFTTVSHFENSDEKRIKSIYQYKIRNYKNLLLEYFEEYGYSIPQNASGNKPSIYNVKEYSEPLVLSAPIPDIYPETVNQKKEVPLDTWEAFVENKKIAGASWILFKDFYSNEETKERIEVGVYILLHKPVALWDEDKSQQEDEINKFIHFEVIQFLYDNSIAYMSKQYVKEKFEKKQLNREKMLYVGMGHYIKNSTLGLEAHENEIIQYLKSLTNTDTKILVTAQLQKLIYSLIRLYLQIRQIAGSGVIDVKVIQTKVQVNLYNLINLIYLHIIITRGKFYISLDNPNNLDSIKNIVTHQNEIIGKLTELLQNQTFEQADIDAVLSKNDEIDSFHSLAKSGYEILIKIDPILKMKVELNSIQFKYLYTVFAEIFDNCFSNKHSPGSRTAYLYFGNDYQDYNTITVSSRDSSIDMDNLFKFEDSELCSDCASTGNGVKIVQSALDNEYLKSKLLIPKDSKSKSFTMSNGGEISVFEYRVKLNKNLFI
ncbi:MAG: hypothetical protein IPN29_09870 [Saprospiraceae bacterium]|nr:hypothetical protein [Saprospiraceae bacterium]